MKYFVVILFFIGVQVHAKGFAKESEESERERTVDIAVPQSQVDFKAMAEPETKRTELAVSTSNWVPSHYRRGGFTGESDAFFRGSLPYLSLGAVTELADLGAGFGLNTRMGASYLSEVRSRSQRVGQIQVGDSNQTVNLWMAEVGLNLNVSEILPWGFEPVIGFSVLPTWVTAEQSVYEKSVGEFGLITSGEVGLLWRLSRTRGRDRGDLSVSSLFRRTNGSVGGASLAGSGFGLEMRLAL